MKVETGTPTSKLSIESNLSPNDLSEAEVRLPELGVEGRAALSLMRKLGAAVAGLEEAVVAFKLALPSETGPTNFQVTLGLSVSPEKVRVLQVPSETKVTALGLSVRARNCIGYANVITVGELMDSSATELLKIRNCNVTVLAEIREKLGKVGGYLKGE